MFRSLCDKLTAKKINGVHNTDKFLQFTEQAGLLSGLPKFSLEISNPDFFQEKSCIIDKILESRGIIYSDSMDSIHEKLFSNCQNAQLSPITESQLRTNFRGFNGLTLKAILLIMDKETFNKFFHQYLSINSEGSGKTMQTICWDHNIARDLHKYISDSICQSQDKGLIEHSAKIIALSGYLEKETPSALETQEAKDAGFQRGVEKTTLINKARSEGKPWNFYLSNGGGIKFKNTKSLRRGNKNIKKINKRSKSKKTKKTMKTNKSSKGNMMSRKNKKVKSG